MVVDRLSRPLNSLRISVTDRCNLRCLYCMPEESYRWLPRQDLLTFEEIVRLTSVFQRLGVSRLRITGGEPLLRKELPVLLQQLSRLGFSDLALTTNGLLLADQAGALRQAGLRRLTVSLDSVRPAVFAEMAQRGGLQSVLDGLEAARREKFSEIKIDTVLLRGRNDDQIVELLDFAGAIGAEIRFIEYMDVGGATRWRSQDVVVREEILALAAQHYGHVETLSGRGSAPAERFGLPSGQAFGIIASVSQPFCQDCDRGRLTADGQFLTCLYARQGLDLRQSLRSPASDEEIVELLSSTWQARSDRGAEARAGLSQRGSFLSMEDLRRDPRLEMHTRGG